MPAFTYLEDCEYVSPIKDGEVQELLTELREKTRQDWRIGEHYFQITRFLRKPVIKKYYQLYVKTFGCEFQVINPVRETEQDCFSIPTRSQIANYILGYLAGLEHRAVSEIKKEVK